MFEVQDRENKGDGRANCTRPNEKIGDSSSCFEIKMKRQRAG